MKTLLMAGLLGSTLLATGAVAQTATTPNNQSSPAANSTQFVTQLNPSSLRMSDFMDLDVFGPDNKEIGEVEDVLLGQNGQVEAVVIEVEDGLNDRTVALPMSAFQLSTAAETTGSVQGSGQNAAPGNAVRSGKMRLMLNMPVDQLKSAPEFDDND
jgi:sporulation protein YlmC with PRC-barrel domain